VKISKILEIMTKKDFKEMASVHKYTGGNREYNQTAVFFDWQSGKGFGGFKYCVSTYTRNIKQQELVNLLYGIITGKLTQDDLPYFVVLDVAENDQQRFKVPICASGLNNLT
jgi:hypothetical protein